MNTAHTASAAWEKQEEIQAPGEPKLHVRVKTQVVIDGVQRYMGENLELPQRQALGLIGHGEAEQVTDESRNARLTWMDNSPGPEEGLQVPAGGGKKQGSREGGSRNRGAAPGEQRERQEAAAIETSRLEHLPPRPAPAPPGRFQGGNPPHQPFSQPQQPRWPSGRQQQPQP